MGDDEGDGSAEGEQVMLALPKRDPAIVALRDGEGESERGSITEKSDVVESDGEEDGEGEVDGEEA